MRELGEVAVKLPVAHREVDVHRDGDDEHQGQEVRRDHGDLPTHQPQHSDHQQTGVEAAGEREHHPSRLAEDQAEHDHEEHRHPDAEHDEVVAHEGDHVVGDHRHAAQVQGASGLGHAGAGAAGELREHAPDGRDLGPPGGGHAALRGLVEALDAVQLGVDRGAPGVVEVFGGPRDQQPVALRQQGAVRLVVAHREQERGGPRVRAHDDFREHRAREQLRLRPRAVRVRVVERAEVVGHRRQRDVVDVVEQGDVEDAGDGRDAGSGAQPVAQRAKPRERRLFEDVAARREGDDEQVLRRVARLQLAQGLEVAVVLQQQRVGRGVELEVARLPREEPEHREHQHQDPRGMREHQSLVEGEQREVIAGSRLPDGAHSRRSGERGRIRGAARTNAGLGKRPRDTPLRLRRVSTPRRAAGRAVSGSPERHPGTAACSASSLRNRKNTVTAYPQSPLRRACALELRDISAAGLGQTHHALSNPVREPPVELLHVPERGAGPYQGPRHIPSSARNSRSDTQSPASRARRPSSSASWSSSLNGSVASGALKRACTNESPHSEKSSRQRSTAPSSPDGRASTNRCSLSPSGVGFHGCSPVSDDSTGCRGFYGIASLRASFCNDAPPDGHRIDAAPPRPARLRCRHSRSRSTKARHGPPRSIRTRRGPV